MRSQHAQDVKSKHVKGKLMTNEERSFERTAQNSLLQKTVVLVLSKHVSFFPGYLFTRLFSENAYDQGFRIGLLR